MRWGSRYRCRISPTRGSRLEDHYYNPTHTGLPSLGLKPTLLSETLIESTLGVIDRYKSRVVSSVIDPSTQWRAPLAGQPAR